MYYIKLTKEQEELLSGGNCLVTSKGDTFYNLPNWYKETEKDGVYEVHTTVTRFPSGLEDWYETFFEVAEAISIAADSDRSDRVNTVQNTQGRGGLYLLAKELTDKFEEEHAGEEWEELDWFETIDEFLKEELYG